MNIKLICVIMHGTVLLVLTNKFDDMAFLTSQVILEENSYDVIIASKESGTCKGVDTSLMTVSLEDALNQSIQYSGLILVGGEGIQDWPLLNQTIQNFTEMSKPIGAITHTISLLPNHSQIRERVSGSITHFQNILFLNKIDDAEEFVGQFIKIM